MRMVMEERHEGTEALRHEVNAEEGQRGKGTEGRKRGRSEKTFSDAACGGLCRENDAEPPADEQE